MLAHTLAKMLLSMDDVPVVIRDDHGDALFEVGGVREIMAKKHEDENYHGLWFEARFCGVGDEKGTKVIEL